jgi:hypothetical protein
MKQDDEHYKDKFLGIENTVHRLEMKDRGKVREF